MDSEPREVRKGGTEGKAVSKPLDSSRVRVRDQEVNAGDSNKEDCCAYPTCESIFIQLV